MVLLTASLLPEGIRVAVVYRCPAVPVRCRLEVFAAREFGSAVGQDDLKEFPEKSGSQAFFQKVEDPFYFLLRL